MQNGGSDTDNRVLIIGGGIGGLATALALQRAGIRVTVFERNKELKEIGTGLAVWANATKALRQLGVADALIAGGTEIRDYQFRTSEGDILIKVSIDELTHRVGAPSVVMRRSDLLAGLYAALDDGVVQLGMNCTGFEKDAEGVTACLEGGREERGRVLIGADGLTSTIRARQLGTPALRYSGYKVWRGIGAFEHPSFPPGSWWLLWGRGARFGMSHVGQGRMYWYGMVNTPEGTPDEPTGRKARVLSYFRGWVEPTEALIEATDEAGIMGLDVRDMPPLPWWSDGLVTLLGDAAHPTTPNLGQGACQAIEDAVMLAKGLALTNGLRDRAAIEYALQVYEARRKARAARITNLSWRIGIVGQWENPILAAVRDAALKIVPNSLMRMSLQSNLAYDV